MDKKETICGIICIAIIVLILTVFEDHSTESDPIVNGIAATGQQIGSTVNKGAEYSKQIYTSSVNSVKNIDYDKVKENAISGYQKTKDVSKSAYNKSKEYLNSVDFQEKRNSVKSSINSIYSKGKDLISNSDNITYSSNYTGLMQFAPDCNYQKLNNKWYSTCYNYNKSGAHHVVWITRKEHLPDNSDRTVFREDRRVKGRVVKPSDYTRSGYDRGHMAPAADFDWNQDAQNSTFLMSNIMPQTPSLNRGIWKILESKTRDWTVRNDSLLVMCGPIYEKDISLECGLPLPTSFWKVIVKIENNTIVASAWVMPNADIKDTDIDKYQVNISYIESLTDIQFFSHLNVEEQEKIKSKKITMR